MFQPGKIRIAFAKKQNLYASALLYAFNGDDEMFVSFITNNQMGLLDHLRIERLDVLILDLNVCERNSCQLISELKQHYPHLKIIVTSSDENRDVVLNSFTHGANAFLSVNTSIDEMQIAIRTVYQKGIYYTEIASKMLHEKYKENFEIDPIFCKTGILFTTAELDIIRLTCNEYTSKHIAKELNLSERTVEAYRKKIFTKIGCKNTVGLTLFAVKHEIIRI